MLFDFKAAFPSTDHAFMWEALSSAGIPRAFMDVLNMFYHNNFHYIKVRGGLHRGPAMRSGVRQGARSRGSSLRSASMFCLGV